MKRRMLFVVFILLCSSYVFALTKGDVMRMLESEVSGEAYLWPERVSNVTLVEDETIIAVDHPAWLVWIDEVPGAMFGHPTRYVFVYDDGSTREVVGSAVARVNGEDIRTRGIRFVELSVRVRSIIQQAIDGLYDTIVFLRSLITIHGWFYKEMPEQFCEGTVDSYAVLIQSINDSEIDLEYEIDALYDVLRARIPEDQLYVVSPYRGLPPTKESLVRVFDELREKIDCDDSLFVFLNGHARNLYEVTAAKWDSPQLFTFEVIGEPFAQTKQGRDYSDCYDDTGRINARRGVCKDLVVHHAAIPDGYYIANATLKSWVVTFPEGRISGQFFNDLLRDLNTCDVIFATSACYSGSLMSFVDKPGARIFTASNSTEYAFAPFIEDASKAGVNGSYFGYAFIRALDWNDLDMEKAFSDAEEFVHRRVPELLSDDKEYRQQTQNPQSKISGSCSCYCRSPLNVS